MPAFVVPANRAFDSYSALVTALNDWLDRSDLSGSAPSMIALAEAQMRRELAPLLPETSASVSVVNGSGSLPNDCSTVRTVVSGRHRLPQIGPSAGVDMCGPFPLAWSLEADVLRLWPVVTAVVTVLYEPNLPQLTDTSPSNFILSGHPDLYFFGSMMFAEGYLANDNRAALFKGLWEEALQSAKVFFTRQRFGGPLVPRVAFVP